ncbi:MAG: DUF4386 domain-containing protein [Alphaproteobacteria bacterium]|nr:DUF4386 domain-containing protein [Alphaproteobacteria bacterium]
MDGKDAPKLAIPRAAQPAYLYRGRRTAEGDVVGDAADFNRQRKIAGRWAGFFYLAYIAAFIFASYVQEKPVVWGDAAATAHNIATAEFMFRVGFMTELLAAALFLLAAWSLYVLLSPVGKNAALLFLVLNAVGVAEQSQNTLAQFAVLPLVDGAAYLKAFSAPQLQAHAMLFLHLKGAGFTVFNIAFALWLFPLAWLVIKSRFIPKIFGVLLLLDGVCLLVWIVQMGLFPGYERFTHPLFPVMLIAELSFALWLFIVGARTQNMVA